MVQVRPESSSVSLTIIYWLSLSQGEPKWEVSRYFLSSLMMANTMNVQVVTPSDGRPCDQMVDTMALRLLSKERNRERYEGLV